MASATAAPAAYRAAECRNPRAFVQQLRQRGARHQICGLGAACRRQQRQRPKSGSGCTARSRRPGQDRRQPAPSGTPKMRCWRGARRSASTSRCARRVARRPPRGLRRGSCAPAGAGAEMPAGSADPGVGQRISSCVRSARSPRRSVERRMRHHQSALCTASRAAAAADRSAGTLRLAFDRSTFSRAFTVEPQAGSAARGGPRASRRSVRPERRLGRPASRCASAPGDPPTRAAWPARRRAWCRRSQPARC